MALLGFNIDLKNVLIIVVFLMIVSFGLGYCVGTGTFQTTTKLPSTSNNSERKIVPGPNESSETKTLPSTENMKTPTDRKLPSTNTTSTPLPSVSSTPLPKE